MDAAFIVADDKLKRNEIYVAASRSRDECKLYVDRESVEKSVRSQKKLEELSGNPATKKELKNSLAGGWGKAQGKNSTRDYSYRKTSSELNLSAKSGQLHKTSRQMAKMPSVSLGR